MTDGPRLIAWAAELRSVHARLRAALAIVREGLDAGAAVDGDLLLHCWGFCTALSQHHAGEDAALFPAIEAEHPALASTLRRLTQDHSMLEHLLVALREAAGSGADASTLDRHVAGIEAIMESHFGFEERSLLEVLERLALDADVRGVLGPLAR